MLEITDSVSEHVCFSMWELCNAEHSSICEVCVPILLHCVTLPSGSDVFWKILQDEFHNSDWRVRFVAGKCDTRIFYKFVIFELNCAFI